MNVYDLAKASVLAQLGRIIELNGVTNYGSKESIQCMIKEALLLVEALEHFQNACGISTPAEASNQPSG